MSTRAKQNWLDVWSNRKLDASKLSTLEQLLAVDGMDTIFGAMSEEAWLVYIQRISQLLGISCAEHSILEIGCGGGAFLYPFYEKGHRIAGIDQSEALIKIARSYLPGGVFSTCFANGFSSKSADYVFSMGVFLYFPNLEYAQNVIQKMSSHAINAIAILDIPDYSKKKQAESERRAMMSPKEYQTKYEGLEHLYYEKDWFIQEVKKLNFSRYHIEDQLITGYKNAEHRFNVFAWK